MNKFNETKIGLVDNGVKISPVEFFIETTYVDTKGESRPCFNITRKGCEFIANKLTGTKGTIFTARYVNRFHEMEEGNITNVLINTLNSISQTMIDIRTSTNNQFTAINERLEKLEKSQSNRYLLEKKYPSAWYKKMSPKFDMLQEYFKCDRKILFSNIYKELEDTYDIDVNQIHEDYCYENHLLKEECFRMDAIEHNTKLRDALTLLIDNSLVRFGLQTEEQIRNYKRKTLFDQEPCSGNA